MRKGSFDYKGVQKYPSNHVMEIGNLGRPESQEILIDEKF